MDTKEASSILAEHLARYRSRPYAELSAWARERRIDTAEGMAPSGHRYEIEVQFFWDDKPDGDVRVSGSISGGHGIRAFVPLTKGFVMPQEGVLDSWAENKASEFLLKVCYFPFVAVGGVTVAFYDVAQMEEHPVMSFALTVGVLHAALLAFWALVFRPLLAKALEQVSFSRATASAGLLAAYVMGLFIGWLVHMYG